MSETTMYFNPNCSKCQQTKSLLEEKNVDAKIIEYLQSPPSRQDLEYIVSLGIPVQELIRPNEKEWKALGIDLNSASEDQLLDAIVSAPQVLQRPIVIANGKATLGRPPEKVLNIL